MEDRDDIVISGIEDEMMVLKGVLIALVEVINSGKGVEGETLEVLRAVIEVRAVTTLLVPDWPTSVVEARMGKVFVIEVTGASVCVGVVISVVDLVGGVVGVEGPEVGCVAGMVVVRVDIGLVFAVEVETGSAVGEGGGEDGVIFVWVGEVLERASVELSSVVGVNEPVVLKDVDSVLAGVIVLPVEKLVEDVMSGVLCGVTDVGVVTIFVVPVLVIFVVEVLGNTAVFEVASVELSIRVFIPVLVMVTVLVVNGGVDVASVGIVAVEGDSEVVLVLVGTVSPLWADRKR